MNRRAVFLDRDGTINEDVGLSRADGARSASIPTAMDAVRRINDAGFAVVVVTNQSGSRPGLVHGGRPAGHPRRDRRPIFAAAGARIDAIYYCPHFIPVRRSPLPPGLPLPQARSGDGAAGARTSSTSTSRRSYMVGDKVEDIRFGLADRGDARPRPDGIRARSPRTKLGDAGIEPASVAADLGEAVRLDPPPGSRPGRITTAMIRFDDILEKVAAGYGEKDIAAPPEGLRLRRPGPQGPGPALRANPISAIPSRSPSMLADMHLDATTLVAGLLHDVLRTPR